MAGRIALATLLVFVVLIAGLHVTATRMARHNAETRLLAAAEDIVVDLDDCVGRHLAFVGNTICNHYRSPEAMKNVDMRQVMAVYGLDELNAVDARGIIVASTLPIVGDDQWKKVNPAKFNRALLKENRGMFAQCFRPSADEPGVYYKYVGVSFPPPAKGYLQLGFKRARMQNSFDYVLQDLVSDWHIGETGFYVISKTSNGEILSTMDKTLRGKTLGNAGFDIFRARKLANVDRRDPVSQEFFGFRDNRVNCFESDFAGRRCLCTSGVVNQFHRYIAAIPLAEVYGSARRLVLITALLLLAALIAAYFVFLRQSRLVAQLQTFIAADRERRVKDLSLAKTIQSSSLPVVFPKEAGYEILARMDTAREVGGDFYDFFTLPSGKLFFLVADVSGKGIPAALFMMRAKAIVRAEALRHDDLASAVAAANDALSEKNDAEMFVTAWIGTFEAGTGAIGYVNAGHNAPLVRHADGTVEWLRERSGLVLAAMSGVPYRLRETSLRPGDTLFLYTDGVTEAMNAAGEQYGEDRLENILRRTEGDFLAAVRADVDAFVAGFEPSDDITMLALARRGDRISFEQTTLKQGEV